MKKLLMVTAVIITLVISSVPAFAAEPVQIPGTEVNAYTLYSRAMKKAEDATSIMNSGIIRMRMSFDGETIDTRSTYTQKTLVTDEGEIQMSMVQDTEFGDIKSYFRDGWLFVDTGEAKTRTRTNILDLQSNDLPEEGFPKELFKDAVVEDVEGGKRIKLNLSKDMVTEWVGEGAAAGLAATGVSNADLKFSSMIFYMTIGDDGMLKSYQMLYNMSMKIEGIKVLTSTNTTINFDSFNSFDKIDFPRDLSSYERV